MPNGRPDFDAPFKDMPCTVCGIRLGKHYITNDGTPGTAKHYLKGSTLEGCHQALVDEVKSLREQVDYLTDLVEIAGPSTRVAPVNGLVPPCNQLPNSHVYTVAEGYEGRLAIMETNGTRFLIVEDDGREAEGA